MAEDEQAPPEELSRLYERPPSEFVAARNDLAARLRGEGRQQAADAIRRISRPALPLWAINRLAWEAGDELSRLLDLGEDLRAAQSRVVGGDRQAATQLRDLAAEETALIRRLRERAAAILTETGHAASEAALRRIETTLRGAAIAAPDVKIALSEGRLASELELGGFGELPALSIVPQPAPRRSRRDPDAEARRSEARHTLAAAERDVGERETAVRRAQREVERTAIQLERAQAAVGAAEQAAADAERVAAQAAAALESARVAAQAARKAVSDLSPSD